MAAAFSPPVFLGIVFEVEKTITGKLYLIVAVCHLNNSESFYHESC
jgi:hypothetical protein